MSELAEEGKQIESVMLISGELKRRKSQSQKKKKKKRLEEKSQLLMSVLIQRIEGI